MMRNIDLSGKTVLIVEDDQLLLNSLRIKLEKMGYRVLTASDGQEGLHLAVTETVDLILVDILMPKMDGITMITRLRPLIPKTIPIIILTAKGEEVDRIVGLELGADDYIVKPFKLGSTSNKYNATAHDVGENFGRGCFKHLAHRLNKCVY